MIYIATVHHKNPFWVNTQLKFIKKNFSEEYKTYAYLDSGKQLNKEFEDSNFSGINKEEFKKFDVVIDSINKAGGAAQHSQRLKKLYKEIFKVAKDEDIIIFLDSDALLINPTICNFIHQKLRQHELIGVQRLENTGDKHPHPMFCVATVKTWKKIHKLSNGNIWGMAYSGGINHNSEIGGVLLNVLNRNNIKWYKMKRSNTVNYHDVFFGIYDNLIYHHGGGSRGMRCRHDYQKYGGAENYIKSPEYKKVLQSNKRILNDIDNNENFYKQFITT